MREERSHRRPQGGQSLGTAWLDGGTLCSRTSRELRSRLGTERNETLQRQQQTHIHLRTVKSTKQCTVVGTLAMPPHYYQILTQDIPCQDEAEALSDSYSRALGDSRRQRQQLGATLLGHLDKSHVLTSRRRGVRAAHENILELWSLPIDVVCEEEYTVPRETLPDA